MSGSVPLIVRKWRDIGADMNQSALDQHFLSLHLGGPKRIRRMGEGSTQIADAAVGSFSIIPAGAAFRWETSGPIDFAHFYFRPDTIKQAIEQAFDGNPASVDLGETLGLYDPLVHALALALLDEVCCQDFHQAYVDDMARLLLVRVIKLTARLPQRRQNRDHRMAPFRLKRAIDFIEQNLGEPIGVADMARAAGLSVYYFSRSFRLSTGTPPHAYILSRRLNKARHLLTRSTLSHAAIASACGFSSPSQFATAFRRSCGLSPSDFRRAP